MKLGESTPKGGRPPYILEEEDIKLAEELASHGYSLKAIAGALGVEKQAFFDLKNRDNEFSNRLKKGVMRHCLKVEKDIMVNDIPPALYIYWFKTKWKNFYPQEEKQVVDFQNRPDVKVIFENKPEPVIATVQTDTAEKITDDTPASA